MEREQASGQPPSPEMQKEMQAQQQQQQAAAQQQQIQQQEIGLKMAEQKAKTDKAEAEARKANAEADKLELEVQAAKQRLASAHMDELRTIEAHDHNMARGHVRHAQDTTHKQDRHSADMTILGLDAARAGEKHDATIEQMKAPPEMAEAE
jgi:hypothetical protein